MVTKLGWFVGCRENVSEDGVVARPIKWVHVFGRNTFQVSLK